MQLAVIEGFFGRRWSQPARLDTIRWLADNAYQLYVYAPKEDKLLRGQWAEAGDAAWLRALRQMAQCCSEAGIGFGVGLSPLGAVRDFGAAARAALAAKLAQLDAAGVTTLAILFDDMRCEFDDLAARQLAIADFICQHSRAQNFLVCPSYYSFDPVLARVFGAMPADYWHDLGRGLDGAVDLLWTGNKVCSDAIQLQDMQAAAAALGRMPVLWDNYPVNDGEKACGFLHLRAFANRDPTLQYSMPGHWVNPMNQPLLSRPALASLPRLYSAPRHYDALGETALQFKAQFGAALGEAVHADLALFSDIGLQQMTVQQRQALRARYAGCIAERAGEAQAAAEIVQWLDGEFAFDPACLTEE